jgi:hypothetical protein
MRCMGFTHDPGPLPFVTIRHDKWANRLVELPQFIECKGEHGCLMGTVVAKAVKVEPYTGECPAHLANVYKGQRLCAITMVTPNQGDAQ